MMKLTLEQELEAASEGWRVLGGYVARTYDVHGMAKFAETKHVVVHIRERGRTSEWHKEFYLSLPWGAADDIMAHAEGWQLMYDMFGVKYQTIFKTLEEVQAHIQKGITEGDPLALKAIRTLAKRKLRG